MPKNRMADFERPNIESFDSFSSFSISSPYIGFDMEEFVKAAKQQSFIEGLKKGREEAFKSIDKFITEQIDRYVMLNTRIIDYVKKTIESTGSPVVKLNEVRVNFNHMPAGIINIVFLVETEPENELWFISLLSGLEKKVLEEDKHVAELRFINQKGKEINRDLLESEFPLQRTFKDA